MKKLGGINYVFVFCTLVFSFQALLIAYGASRSSAGNPLVHFYNSIIANSGIAGTVFLLIYLSIVFNAKSGKLFKTLSFALRLLAFIISIIVLLDVMLLREFAARLVLNDVAKYYGDISETMSFFSASSLDFYVISLAFTALVIRAFFVIPAGLTIQSPKQHKILCSFIAIPIIANLTIPRIDNTDRLKTSNVFTYNRIVASEYKEYSTAKINQTKNPFKISCTDQKPKRENYVFYMVESLSSYHSKYFSGLNDWTPQLDKLAKENTAYTNFHANGFTTEDGEISYLSGELPIFPPKSFTAKIVRGFNGFWHPKNALPVKLAKNGYRSAFMTTADLTFSDTDQWTASLEFDHVEGSENKFYEDWPRYMFDAAPDEALVNRVLSTDFRKSDGNYFTFIKTVSTHRPFFDPDTKQISEAATVRYADKQLGRLYRKLKEENFFDNGVLIIAGDHRSMTPLTQDEIKKYGKENALSRIPLVVIGKDKDFGQKTIDLPFQQHDLYASITGRVAGQRCIGETTGAMFGDKLVSPKYIYHHRGDIRNMFSIFTKDKVLNVQLDGDETGFTNPEVATASDSDIIEYLNYRRIQGSKNVTLQYANTDEAPDSDTDQTKVGSIQ